MNCEDSYIKHLLRKEYIRNWVKQDRAFNEERYRQNDRKYYERHKESILFKKKERYLNNRERYLQNRRDKYEMLKSLPNWEEQRLARNARERENYARKLVC